MPRKSSTYSKAYRRATAPQRSGRHPYINATAPAIGYAAMKLAKYAVNHLNVEYKFINAFSATPTQLSTSGLLRQFLPDVSQGDTSNDRDGATIQWMSAAQRFTLKYDSMATGPQQVRHIIFKVLNVNNTSPAIVDLLAAPSNVNSPRNLDETSNIKVLKDKTYTLWVDKPIVTGKVSLNWKSGMRTKYSKASTSGNNAAIETNYVYELWVCDAGSNGPHLEDCRRARFIDN